MHEDHVSLWFGEFRPFGKYPVRPSVRSLFAEKNPQTVLHLVYMYTIGLHLFHDLRSTY